MIENGKIFELIKSDFERYSCYNSTFLSFLKTYLTVPGARFMFWFRLASSNFLFLRLLFGGIARFLLRHYRFKYGIEIYRGTQIGPGFYIGHFGAIVVNRDAIIGENCSIHHCVTIGIAGSGTNRGVPVIGDNVDINPGAKVFGKIVIGDNVTIGANAVVNKSVGDNAVVAGVPFKIIKFKDYVNK